MKNALILNALFSSISGVILICFHTAISVLFGLESGAVFWIIGIALIYFAGTIAYETKKLRRTFILLIIAQDLLWVIASIVILLIHPFGISSNGNITIGVIAVIVLGMAINQYRALKQML